STPPSGSGASSPASQCPGFNVTLTVTVTLGSSPSSPITSVVGDLSAIGGPSSQAFLDNGNPPDATAGDNIFTATGAISSSITPGNKNIPVVITDQLGRMGNASIT